MNKNFWEGLLFYLPLNDTDRIENDAYNCSIVTCALFVLGTCLPVWGYTCRYTGKTTEELLEETDRPTVVSE
jgi:hypothetical protein